MAKRLLIPEEDIETFAQVLENGLNTPLYEFSGSKLSDEFAAYLTDWIEEHNG